MKKLSPFCVAMLFVLTLSGCGQPVDRVSLCKQECEKSVDASERGYCLSACEMASKYVDEMENGQEVPVEDIVNDFNESIYGNMNEEQKSQMRAMQEAGMIPDDLSKIPSMPMNPEDWEPNEDNLDNDEECAGVFCD